MAVQTQVPGGVNEDGTAGNNNNNSSARWVMDPAKGKIVVALVALVLIIGVAIGFYQVYLAAQYKPPPKPVKEPKIGLVGGKKVKKKQAYYKKGGPIPPPAGKELQSLLESSPQGTNRSSMNSQQQQLQPMQERTRNDLLPVPASSSSFTSPTNNNNNNNNGSRRNDVLIDIQDSSQGFSSTFRGPLWQQGGAGGSSGGGGFQGPDLIQFGHEGGGSGAPAQNPYRTGPSYSSQPTGRSGEVLVPMHQLSHRPSPSQSPTRMNGRSP